MSSKTAEFLPFHAVNEFMRPDYRLTVVRAALNALPGLPGHFRAPIDRLTKQMVRVPGFRNSTLAPASFKVAPMAQAFEKSAELAAAIVAAWAEARAELRTQVYAMLKARNWEVLPPEADRTKLPGFLTYWPKGENFKTLTHAYAEAHAEGANGDDVSLMVVWVSGRLPFRVGETEGEESEQAGPKPD